MKARRTPTVPLQYVPTGYRWDYTVMLGRRQLGRVTRSPFRTGRHQWQAETLTVVADPPIICRAEHRCTAAEAMARQVTR